MKQYDIIIAGGGMAGLSLCYYLGQSSLRNSSILLIDRDVKERNDRTWCFWERGEGPFESIVFKQWHTVEFFDRTLSSVLPMGAYSYKMVRGIDFYRFIRQSLVNLPNIELSYATIDSIEDTPAGGLVTVGDESYLANYVFDSISALQQFRPDRHNLMQHFRGWVITADHDCFEPESPRIMDFRVSQQQDCRFVYMLPFSKRTALVEYTIFSQQLLPEQEYESALRSYINEFLAVAHYQITETECGVIPMSDERPPTHPTKHVIRIGTSGGYTKPSTGYTFQRTQENLREIVRSLTKTGTLTQKTTGLNTWLKRGLDTVFLNVLINNRHPASDIFTRLFTQNDTNLIFRFMDEHTTVREDLRIIGSMPKLPFAMAALDSIYKQVKWLF